MKNIITACDRDGWMECFQFLKGPETCRGNFTLFLFYTGRKYSKNLGKRLTRYDTMSYDFIGLYILYRTVRIQNAQENEKDRKRIFEGYTK